MGKKQGGGKKDDKKGDGKTKKLKKSSQKYKLYDQGKPKNKFCPKCGPGVFMASHSDRLVCGACKYVEKKTAAPKEETKK